MLRVTIHNVYLQTQTAASAVTTTVIGKIPVKTVILDTNDWTVRTVSSL